jgi:hypothetical protein
MKTGRYATSRQKACLSCSTAKAKCDRKAEGFNRCSRRHLSCTYPQTVPCGASTYVANANAEGELNSLFYASSNPWPHDTSPSNNSSATFAGQHYTVNSTLNVVNRLPGLLDALDFSNLELFCPINPDDIRNRWLNTYVPGPEQKIKEYPASITAYIYRILQSYAGVTVRGHDVPPFVHASQTIPTSMRPPLSTCLTLVRICEKPLPGSEDVAMDVLHGEMNNLYEQHDTYNDMDLLAAFQAYLIYSMVLFFRLGPSSNPFLRQAMMNLQSFASSTSRHGLSCVAEKRGTRPRWEAWIVAESKRRTLFVMYFLDSVLSSQDGLPTLLGTELQGLPAPSSRFLWRAQTRHEWETAYNRHLVNWTKGGLRIDELWPVPEDLSETSLLERRSRVDLWLESVDDFGTMLYAVTSCTHGG